MKDHEKVMFGNAAEMKCSPLHDFRHEGLHSHMPWACGLHRAVAGRAGENKVCRLGSFSTNHGQFIKS